MFIFTDIDFIHGGRWVFLLIRINTRFVNRQQKRRKKFKKEKTICTGAKFFYFNGFNRMNFHQNPGFGFIV